MKGFTVERAPIQRISTPAAKASSTCFAFATSTAVGKPVSALARFNHSKPMLPIPSNSPGRVRGFQIPARKTDTLPVAASKCAVVNNCSSVSALHGPEMINGSLFTFNQVFNGWMFKFSFMMMGVFKVRTRCRKSGLYFNFKLFIIFLLIG
ncbi:hypothetical protein D3C72_1783850 [compost metagenome]